MFLFKRGHTLLQSGIFEGFVDYHSHILPGVDDGIQTLEDSLAVLEYYETLGVTTVWCTPHIMEDIPNTTDELRARFAELQETYKGNIVLHLASENMIDGLFEERLQANDFLPMGFNGDHLLVETSYFNPPANFYEMLERVKSKGYFPILAHPERYVYMDENDYMRLQSMGVRFQLNLMSLVGQYGNGARKKAEWLLKHNMYDYRGSDIHSLRAFKSGLDIKSNLL